ncbi:hypothetical protein ABTZ03_35655 [Kitasatospora sp. NPDC096077]|uniref:hypothetical protein n=1 Tax=Kitasatospora sp. NPDC096077 TaxID=3155544 RepID=UPI00331D91F7
MINPLKRALVTAVASGTLLLTVGALPASAHSAVTGQATYTAYGFGASDIGAAMAARAGAFRNGVNAGYTAAQCHLSFGPMTMKIGTYLWRSVAQVTCNA